MIAWYVIGSAIGLVVLSVRLHDARRELARLEEEHDDAWAEAVWMSVSCLLAGLAAASWYAPGRPAREPADGGRAGERE